MEDNCGVLVKGAPTPLELCDDRGLSVSSGGSAGSQEMEQWEPLLSSSIRKAVSCYQRPDPALTAA